MPGCYRTATFKYNGAWQNVLKDFNLTSHQSCYCGRCYSVADAAQFIAENHYSSSFEKKTTAAKVGKNELQYWFWESAAPGANEKRKLKGLIGVKWCVRLLSIF